MTKKLHYLTHFYENNNYTNHIEIGIDEVGRGPMFGRVYTASVILPKNNIFKYEILKDSKKFTSKKKLKETADYIKENCLYWSIDYKDEKNIDKVNIRNATLTCMHESIKNIIERYNKSNETIYNLKNNFYILVDGNDFKPFTYYYNNNIEKLTHFSVEGGDNKYCSIAAASILAKVERDKYIYEICEKYPLLNSYYDLNNNKGYGTAKHMEGIKKYGISPWHRTTYGICKTSNLLSYDLFNQSLHE